MKMKRYIYSTIGQEIRTTASTNLAGCWWWWSMSLSLELGSVAVTVVFPALSDAEREEYLEIPTVGT